MNFPPDRHGDNRWNQCLDRLIAAWNRVGPDVTLEALTALELEAAAACRFPCDADCEIGPVHCEYWHLPNHKPDWHDPAACDESAATGGEVA